MGTSNDCIPTLTKTLALAPEGILLCSATVELTQDDIDGGELSSAVFARGHASDGQSVLGEDLVTQELGQAAGLSIGVRIMSLENKKAVGHTLENKRALTCAHPFRR